MLKNIPIIRDIDFEALLIRMNEMDFEGQKTSEKIYRIIFAILLIISLIVSYYYQKLSFGVYGMMGAFVIATIVTVPSWGCYNRNKLNWLPHKKEELHLD